MDTNTIGGRLDKAMRDARVESQSQLARISGVPQPTINRILKGEGKRGPESATLIALANATGVEFLWLQQGHGPQKAGETASAGGEAAAGSKAKLHVVEPEIANTLQWVTAREAELLSEFRACEEPQKKRLLSSARGLPKAVSITAARDKA